MFTVNELLLVCVSLAPEVVVPVVPNVPVTEVVML
jgi:hypothetical protein